MGRASLIINGAIPKQEYKSIQAVRSDYTGESDGVGGVDISAECVSVYISAK
jgi:hypothetical protein